MPSLPNPHEPGEILGPYRLERRLGRGAAAEVWLVVETGAMGFSKRQALKLLRPPPGELESQKKALINEARVCGRLGHPGIVDVYGVGDENGELFIAMEFVDGPDLNSLLEALRADGTPIPLGAGIDLCIDLCDALDHAHNACEDDGTPLNVVHRDLKPSNVLVDRRGVVKISDWGLVKSTLNIESTTRGIVKGTPGYIAPEVWGGTRNFQPSVDLFAVGAMLYEVVVGKRLFRGRNLARIAEQVARRKPSEEASHAAERAPALVPVLERVLQRVPDRRYQTALELAEELRDVRDTLPSRDNFKSFLRSVPDVVQRVAPASLRSGESSRPSQSTRPRPTPVPSVVTAAPVSIGPEVGAIPEPPAPSKPAASSKPAPSEPAPTRAMPAMASVPPTQAPAPEPALSAPVEPPSPGPLPVPVDATTSAPRIAAAQVKTTALPSIPEIATGPQRAAPADSPAPDKGAKRRGKKRKQAARPPGKTAPVRDPTQRPPPPTSAVVVVTVGLLLLLAGLLITFLE